MVVVNLHPSWVCAHLEKYRVKLRGLLLMPLAAASGECKRVSGLRTALRAHPRGVAGLLVSD